MITDYEKQYMKALTDIYENGYSDGVNERTGVSTKRLPGIVFRVDVEKEFPILKSKFVAGKTAQREIEWIWKQQSNNIRDLKAKIWDEWADEMGSINKAYGYQMAKPVQVFLDPVKKKPETFRKYKSQAHYIIELLKENPNSRWGVATLWNPAELSEMNLVPCCHTSTWNLDGGRLNCMLDQRSGDMPYGVPFNTTQYAELMCMIAKELGVKPGILTHVIADAHIYDRQMEGVKKQIMIFEALTASENGSSDAPERINALVENGIFQSCEEAKERLEKTAACVPVFKINTDKGFFDYTADDCSIEDYTYAAKIDFGDVVV